MRLLRFASGSNVVRGETATVRLDMELSDLARMVTDSDAEACRKRGTR